jgi:hypothetical protein
MEVTGQRWKLYVFVAFMLFTFACLFGLFGSIGNGPEELTVSLAIGMVLGAALGHLWIALAVRCGSCRRRVGWLLLMAAGKQWLSELWRGETCPCCGDRGAPAR